MRASVPDSPRSCVGLTPHYRSTSSANALRMGQWSTKRKPDQPGAAVDAKLLADLRRMVLDSSNGSLQRCGDLLIGKTLSNKLEDLRLARRQTLTQRTVQPPAPE